MLNRRVNSWSDWESQNGVLKFISAIAQAESCIMKRIKRTNELITLVKGEVKDEIFNCDSWF